MCVCVCECACVRVCVCVYACMRVLTLVIECVSRGRGRWGNGDSANRDVSCCRSSYDTSLTDALLCHLLISFETFAGQFSIIQF